MAETSRRRRTADDSLTGERLRSAGIRACDSHAGVRRMAERICEELEDVTSPGGVQVSNFDEEDSMVTSVAAVIESHTANGKANEPR